jgi:hypothetical protein
MDLSLNRAPKKNHEAMVQIGKANVQRLKKHRARAETYHLSTTTSEGPDGVESIAKTLSVGENEEVQASLQLYKDGAHSDEVHAKICKTKVLENL